MAPRIASLLLACCALFVACGDDDVGFDGDRVGGACRDGRDCEYLCERDDHFPDGTCTLPCNVDEDCPLGTYCIDREDGICLLGCERPEDCREGYTCKGEHNRGHDGESLVCIH
jgi:hypothetical protein